MVKDLGREREARENEDGNILQACLEGQPSAIKYESDRNALLDRWCLMAQMV